MPMSWTPEANAKLFIGVLEQIKTQSVKLDYKALAEHMGPECNTKSVQNQFTKLKKQAAEECGTAGANAAAIPNDTLKKRRAAAGSKTGTPAKKKRADSGATGGDSDAEGETDIEQEILDQVRAELKDLV
ncbi:hypothetical protein BDW72DRAFT_197634 [Aspergillus terricola var. indicus]